MTNRWLGYFTISRSAFLTPVATPYRAVSGVSLYPCGFYKMQLRDRRVTWGFLKGGMPRMYFQKEEVEILVEKVLD